MTLRVAFFVFMPVHQHEKRTNATIRKTNGIALSTRIDKCGNVSLGVSYLKYHEKYIFRQQISKKFFVNPSTKNSIKEYHPQKYNFGCACSSKMSIVALQTNLPIDDTYYYPLLTNKAQYCTCVLKKEICCLSTCLSNFPEEHFYAFYSFILTQA